MPLIPAIPCEGLEPTDGCTDLHDMGVVILDAGLAALAPYEVEGGCGGSLDGYVSIGEPTPGCCDILGVHLLSYGPTGVDSSVNPRAQRPRWTATWKIDLFLGCYPLDTGIDQPAGIPLDHLHQWGQYAHALGLAVYQAVWDEWRDGDLNACDALDFGPLVPIAPSGTCAGWSFTIAGDVP